MTQDLGATVMSRFSKSHDFFSINLVAYDQSPKAVAFYEKGIEKTVGYIYLVAKSFVAV